MLSDNAGCAFSLSQAFRLKGHEAAVLCCASAGRHVISGAEDGRLLVHDLSSSTSGGGNGNSTAAATPSDATASTPQRPAVRHAPALKPVLTVTLPGPDAGSGRQAAVTAVAVHPFASGGGGTGAETANSIFAAVGSLVHHVDLRSGSVVQTYSGSRDEVNGLCVSGRGTHLAAADDAGEVQVYDLTAGRQFKSIRNVHRSIAASVAFRAHKPWDLLSGGLDASIAKYDFSRPKCIDRWDMNALAGPGGGGGGGGGGQIFNPPFVHQIAVPPGEDRPTCQWVAAARGDGAVMVLDADVSSAASGSSGPTTQVAAGRRGGGGKAPGGARGGGGGGAMQPLTLDRDAGGHTAPVCSVAFAPVTAAAVASGATGTCRLYSGGEDCRVILWDVRQALEARAAGLALVPPAAVGQQGNGSGEDGKGGAGVREGQEGAEDGVERQDEHGEEGAKSPSSGGVREVEEKRVGRTAVLAEVRHPRKVNQLCAMEVEGGEYVAVSAVSKFVTVYQLRASDDAL